MTVRGRIYIQSDEVRRIGLRERKKRLAQETIEETALRLFRERGYEETSIQDIADRVMMSPRTFFRYFASKEEVLFLPMQTVFADGITFLEHSAPTESLISALSATLVYMGSIYQQDRMRMLVCYQVAMATPTLASAYLYSLATMEPVLCKALTVGRETRLSEQQIRLLVAMAMVVLRIALHIWLENEAMSDLVSLVRENLKLLPNIPEGQVETP